MLDWYRQERYHPFALTHDAADVSGDGDGERPGILMIHGFTGTPDELRPAARLAFEAGFDVEVIALPGMGADLERFRDIDPAEWLEHALDRWNAFTVRYRRRSLLGYSLGAALALHAAASRPPDHLILMAPLVRLADPKAAALPIAKHVVQELAPFKGADFRRSTIRQFFARTMPDLDIDDPEIQRAIREDYVTPTRLIDACRVIGRDAGRLARHIACPTTVIQGRPDGVVGHRNARWLVDHLGGRVAYHEVRGDHLIPFDTMPSWAEVRPVLEHRFALLAGETAS